MKARYEEVKNVHTLFTAPYHAASVSEHFLLGFIGAESASYGTHCQQRKWALLLLLHIKALLVVRRRALKTSRKRRIKHGHKNWQSLRRVI
jgi:hypothetical protein